MAILESHLSCLMDLERNKDGSERGGTHLLQCTHIVPSDIWRCRKAFPAHRGLHFGDGRLKVCHANAQARQLCWRQPPATLLTENTFKK